MEHRIRGYLSRGIISGPISQTPMILRNLEDGHEGLISIDEVLRPFEGVIVSITITVETPTDAEREKLDKDRNAKYSPRR